MLLALNPVRVYESIILSGTAGGTEYGRLPWLALSVLGGHTSNAASEGCHSIAQLIMSDLQTSMPVGDDIRVLTGRLQMIVCLRDGKEPEAVEQLRRSTLTRRRTLSWTSRLSSKLLGELAPSRHWQ